MVSIAFEPKPTPEHAGAAGDDEKLWKGIVASTKIPELKHEGNFVVRIRRPGREGNPGALTGVPFAFFESWDEAGGA